MDSFLSRHFGPSLARTFGSALVHGIYAADSRVLSVRAAFPGIIDAADRGQGSVVRGSMLSSSKRPSDSAEKTTDDVLDRYDLGGVPELMEDVSVYSFKNGIGELVQALENDLRGRNNVQLVSGDAVQSLSKDTSGGFKVVCSSLFSRTPLLMRAIAQGRDMLWSEYVSITPSFRSTVAHPS